MEVRGRGRRKRERGRDRDRNRDGLTSLNWVLQGSLLEVMFKLSCDGRKELAGLISREEYSRWRKQQLGQGLGTRMG